MTERKEPPPHSLQWCDGKDKPDGLSEEERAALGAIEEARRLSNMEPLGERSKVAAWFVRYSVNFYRAARAPLKVETAELRASIADLERQRDGHQQAAGAAAERAEKLQERARELEKQVDQFRDSIHTLERDKDRRIASLQSDLTYAAELLGTADPAAKAANLETVVDLLERLARDESPIVREGAERGLDRIVAQKPSAQKLSPARQELKRIVEDSQKPAAPPSGEVSTENLDQVLRRELCDDGLLVVRGPSTPDDRRWMWRVDEAWPAIKADIRAAVATERERREAQNKKDEKMYEGICKRLSNERDSALAEVKKYKEALEQERYTSIRWAREKDEQRKRAEAAEIERDDLRTEVERLKNKVDDKMETGALYYAEIQDLRAKLEAAELSVKRLGETNVRLYNERRQPVDRERAIEATKRVINGHDLYADVLAPEIVDAILGDAKAEPVVSLCEMTGMVHGIYRLRWKDGSNSMSAVGCDRSGRNWFYPTNWISGPSFDWSSVESAELIDLPAAGTPHAFTPAPTTSKKGVRQAMELATKKFSVVECGGIVNLANFSAALMELSGLRGGVDGELCRTILADRDDVEPCVPGGKRCAHYRIKSPAFFPAPTGEAPIAFEPWAIDLAGGKCVWSCFSAEAREAEVAKVRAIYALVAADHARLAKENAAQVKRVRELEARLREVQDRCETNANNWSRCAGERNEIEKERDRLKSEVERKRQDYVRVTEALDRHVANRQRLALYMEQKFGEQCQSPDSPEEAAIRKIVEQAAEVERLKAAASQPSRCPADGMSAKEVWSAIVVARNECRCGPDIKPCCYEKSLARARELFTPAAPAKVERKVQVGDEIWSVCCRSNGRSVDDTSYSPPQRTKVIWVEEDGLFGLADFATNRHVDDLGKTWWWSDPSAKGEE